MKKASLHTYFHKYLFLFATHLIQPSIDKRSVMACNTILEARHSTTERQVNQAVLSLAGKVLPGTLTENKVIAAQNLINMEKSAQQFLIYVKTGVGII